MHAVAALGRELHHLGVGQLLDELLALVVVVELAQPLAHLRRGCAGLELAVELAAELARGPSQMGLQDLPDVHPRGHAQRIEHDIDRRPVLGPRHVFFGQDAREHALVAVAPRHLVAHLQAALDRDEDLDHLDHARRQFVARRAAARLLGAVRRRHRVDVRVASRPPPPRRRGRRFRCSTRSCPQSGGGSSSSSSVVSASPFGQQHAAVVRRSRARPASCRPARA